jgi:thioredoxin-like negative regulator of GroEL
MVARVLTAAQLPSAAATRPVFVAHLGVAWHFSDVAFAQALERAGAAFGGRVGTGAVDVDDPRNRSFLERLGLRDVPALACFIRGELTDVLPGPRTEGELRELFLALEARAA